jgi:hypothetical protein
MYSGKELKREATSHNIGKGKVLLRTGHEDPEGE